MREYFIVIFLGTEICTIKVIFITTEKPKPNTNIDEILS